MIITSTFTATAEFAADVRRDLALEPKQLQSKYLYDALGSSLFDAICRLPWYRITRAESRLLRRHAADVVAALGPADRSTIVELGCGSGEKLVMLAEALQAAGRSARVHLIDVSSQALEQTEQRLTRLQHVSVVGHQSTYEVGLRRAAAARAGGGPMLVLLLGSNIGNFDAPAALDFLRRIRLALEPGDLLLLGADLVKPEPELQLAYDDPLGVTAAFNKNLLVRINRELGGNFDLPAFDHLALWNPAEQRIEMHLVSRVAQAVTITAARTAVTFAPGERIWTESSYKYEPDRIERLGTDTGFAMRSQWLEEEARFALSLFVAS
jgi:L-histidine Nalpha-methyltransferase